MTIIDRKNLTIYGTYAMEGINEIWPRPSSSAVKGITNTATDRHPQAIYDLAGREVKDATLQPGIYVSGKRKFLVK